jgi:hypothetical protein
MACCSASLLLVSAVPVDRDRGNAIHEESTIDTLNKIQTFLVVSLVWVVYFVFLGLIHFDSPELEVEPRPVAVADARVARAHHREILGSTTGHISSSLSQQVSFWYASVTIYCVRCA